MNSTDIIVNGAQIIVQTSIAHTLEFFYENFIAIYVYTMYIQFVQTRVKQWGNSLGIRLPKTLTVELGLCDDKPVELTIEHGALVIRPEHKTLDQLVRTIDPGNTHDTVLYKMSGKELW